MSTEREDLRKHGLKSAVITGATGMIGAALSALLTESGVRVTALVRPGSRKLSNLDRAKETGNLTIVPCALSELSAFQPVPANAWFHFGWDGVFGEARNDRSLQERNIEYTLTALRLAKECGAGSLIFAGSQAQYGPVEGILSEDTPMQPVNAYGSAKKAAEEAGRALGRELGIRFITARILSVYGPCDNDYTLCMHTIRTLLRKERPSFTKGEQIWDYLYADDAARAMIALSLSGRGGEAYVLGSGAARPLKEYIELIRDSIDPSLPLGLGDLPYPENQPMHLEADISKLQRDTGFVPKTAFEKGIRKTIEWVRREREE